MPTSSLTVPKSSDLATSPLKKDLSKVVSRSVCCLGDGFVRAACIQEGVMLNEVKRFDVNSSRRACYKGLSEYLEARIRARVFGFETVCEALFRACIQPFTKRCHPQPTCIRELINRFEDQLKINSSFYQSTLPRERSGGRVRSKSSLSREFPEVVEPVTIDEVESVTIGETDGVFEVEKDKSLYQETETELLIASTDYMEIETVSNVSSFSFLSGIETGKSGFDTSSDRDSGRQSSRDVSVSELLNDNVGADTVDIHESTHIGRDFLRSDLDCSAVASVGEASLKRVT